MEVVSNSAIGNSLESRKSVRILLSRSAESDRNCSMFTTMVPIRLLAGSSVSTAMSPATAGVDPSAVRSAPATTSCTE